jgi:hypothetical protein
VNICEEDHEISPLSIKSTVAPPGTDKTGESSPKSQLSGLDLQYELIRATLDWMIRYAKLIRRAESQHRDARAESHEDLRE